MSRYDLFQGSMPLRCRPFLLMGLVLLSLASSLRASGDPSERGEAQPSEQGTRTAAAMVKAMYESRAWVDRARSFQIRVERIIANTDEEARWQTKQPRGPFSPAGNEPPKLAVSTEEWAWDETRIRYSNQWHHDGSFIRVWNGNTAIECSQSANGEHEQYVLGNKPGQFFEHAVENVWSLPWGPGGNHRFWWFPIDVAKSRAGRYLAPNDFELVSEEVVNGRQCHVLLSRAGHTRLHIGQADGRLYRRTWYGVSQVSAGYDYLALCRKIGGDTIKTTYHWQPWLESLEPAQRQRAWRELSVSQFEFARPRIRETLDDYREVAPGCWLPFLQTDDTYNTQAPEPFLSMHTKITVEQARLNQPLADEQFEIELKDGVRVATDWRYDPPIRYSYRKDQPEEERVALCEAAKKKQAAAKEEMDRRQAVIKSRIGTIPPPLPKVGWLAGEPLSWEKLRGKVVVLHFWDIHCAPCQNELPILARWHEEGDESAIVVVGVHRPTDELDAVRAKLGEFGVAYPVLIDAPSEKAGGIGLLHDWFGNTWWPHTVLVGKRGMVAAHGQLWLGDVADQMRRLAAEPK